MHGTVGWTTYHDTKEIQQRMSEAGKARNWLRRGSGDRARSRHCRRSFGERAAIKECDKRTDNVVVRRIEGWRPLRNRLSEWLLAAKPFERTESRQTDK